MNFYRRKDMQDNRVFDKEGNVRDAGAIVSRENKGTREFLLVYRHLQDDYSFPKGRVEKNETAEETAIREVEEETGYKIELLGKLSPVHYNYPEGGGVVVEMFEGKIVGEGHKIET